MRISNRDLEAKVERLNLVMNEQGKLGTYQLSCAYGGYALHRICNPQGGVVDVFNSGHIKGRELFQMLDAFILGVSLSRSED